MSCDGGASLNPSERALESMCQEGPKQFFGAQEPRGRSKDMVDILLS